MLIAFERQAALYRRALRSFWQRGSAVERNGYPVSALLVLSGGVHLSIPQSPADRGRSALVAEGGDLWSVVRLDALTIVLGNILGPIRAIELDAVLGVFISRARRNRSGLAAGVARCAIALQHRDVLR